MNINYSKSHNECPREPHAARGPRNEYHCFRGHKEDHESVNKDNYLETLDFLAIEEAFVKNYLKSSSVFIRNIS